MCIVKVPHCIDHSRQTMKMRSPILNRHLKGSMDLSSLRVGMHYQDWKIIIISPGRYSGYTSELVFAFNSLRDASNYPMINVPINFLYSIVLQSKSTPL